MKKLGHCVKCNTQFWSDNTRCSPCNSRLTRKSIGLFFIIFYTIFILYWKLDIRVITILSPQLILGLTIFLSNVEDYDQSHDWLNCRICKSYGPHSKDQCLIRSIHES